MPCVIYYTWQTVSRVYCETRGHCATWRIKHVADSLPLCLTGNCRTSCFSKGNS